MAQSRPRRFKFNKRSIERFPPQPTHTHTHMNTHACARAHTHTHTQTHCTLWSLGVVASLHQPCRRGRRECSRGEGLASRGGLGQFQEGDTLCQGVQRTRRACCCNMSRIPCCGPSATLRKPAGEPSSPTPPPSSEARSARGEITSEDKAPLRITEAGEPGDIASTELRLRRCTGRRRFLRMWLARGVGGCTGETSGQVGCSSSMVVATSLIGSWYSRLFSGRNPMVRAGEGALGVVSNRSKMENQFCKVCCR